MRSKLIIGCIVILSTWAFRATEYKFTLKKFSYPRGWPAPRYDFDKNPLSEEIVALGRSLFYDPLLSLDNTISCANCHLSYSSFTHTDHALSHGIFDSIGTRNSPVLVNLAWNTSFMWDGAINHIDMQALAPINHPLEMGETTSHVLQKLNSNPGYKQRFREAFNCDTISSFELLKCIAQFQLTLVSSNSKYDKVMRKEAEFTDTEMKGFQLFNLHCNSCHQAPLFTTGNFRSNGLKPDSLLHDLGRFAISHQDTDSFRFKIPTLRNIEYSFPYMHDGRYSTLMEAINHYVIGIDPSGNPDESLKNGIHLSDNERVEIQAFLLTLSDREFIFNKEFAYPR